MEKKTLKTILKTSQNSAGFDETTLQGQ